MALVDNAWYINYGNGTSTGYYAVAQWTALTLYSAGAIIRQLAAPAVGSERVFVCVVAGTTLASEPSWTLTRGATTAEIAGPTWQECTGIAALNGDATNTPSWTITATPPGGVKNTAVTKGEVIKRDNGASYQICTTAGTAGNGSEPSFSNTAGTTTADNTVTWTSLGAVGNFTGWQAPHARLANAYAATWGQATNKFFVGGNHAETQTTAITLTAPGAVATLSNTLSVDQTVAVPPATLTTTATITATGNSNITIAGSAYYYGITFTAGSGANATLINFTGGGRMDSCKLVQGGTSASTSAITISGQFTELVNTTLQFGNTGSRLATGATTKLLWRDTPSAIAGATIPTTLLNATNVLPLFQLIGVDLSGLGSNTFYNTNATDLNIQLIDCKTASGMTFGITGNASVIDIISSDFAATNYQQQRYTSLGTLVPETTIVRTGGATDGTTPLAWKISTTANALWTLPFVCFPISIWNDSTSSITVTVYGIWGGGAVPNNDEIWFLVEYLGSGSTPLSSFVTTTKANFVTAAAALTADGSTWGGSTTAFSMSATFTPAMKGPLNIYVKAAKATSTFYIDPKPVVTARSTGRAYIVAPGVYTNEPKGGTIITVAAGD